ncbi:MAG: hypothetical protein ABI353_18160 [Isosphaeraceae bacterium]
MAARGRDGKAHRGKAASGKADGTDVVKVTLRLSSDTARRLAVEAAMTGQTQSSIAEALLAPYLRRWRLPSTIEPIASTVPIVADLDESAA